MLIENALVLAGTTFTGGLFLWTKLPKLVKHWFSKMHLVTDIVLCVVAYVLLGGTTTALLASGMLGIMVSAALYVANHGVNFA